MADQTSTVNMALSLIGTSRKISSIDDGTEIADKAKAVWDISVKAVLADFPWNFAIERRELAAAAAGPSFGYGFSYPLPGNCARVLDVEAIAWSEEGGAILANVAPPLAVRFVRDDPDMLRWSDGFTEALAAKLAVSLAMPITGRTDIRDRMENSYVDALGRAKRSDSRAAPPQRRRGGRWTGVRGRAGGCC